MTATALPRERYYLEIQSRRAQLNIQSPRPSMEISRTKPEFTVTKKRPTFKVANRSQLNAESGLANPVQLSRQFAQKGRQEGHEAIGLRSQEGDYLMNIHKGGSIAGMAKQRLQKKMPETNVGLMPQSRPQIEWDLGELSIDWSDPKLTIDWNVSRPQLSVTPHVVEINWRAEQLEPVISKRPLMPVVGNYLDSMI
ncbi:DUF6470 family protein [Eubacteriales bacterium OttesenSCG-928-N14]|nr:DUF6470 family protein [Eubacteriales bacterium OttesenSCG-928-N14]